MAKVNRCIPTVVINDYLSLFAGMGCSLIRVDTETSTITIANNITVQIVTNSGYTNGRDWIITYNGNVYTLLQQQSATVWICCSDTFVWFTVESSDTNKILFLYEKINNASYCGHAYVAKSGNPDIHSVTIMNESTLTTYTHGKVLNYTCESIYPDCFSYLDYSSDTLISDGVVSDVIDTNTLTCSTTTINKIITFAGLNYFALGTNTVIPLDAHTVEPKELEEQETT